MLSGLVVRCGFTVALNLMCTWVGTGLLRGLAGAVMENYSGWSYAQHSLTDRGGYPKVVALLVLRDKRGDPLVRAMDQGKGGTLFILHFRLTSARCVGHFVKI